MLDFFLIYMTFQDQQMCCNLKIEITKSERKKLIRVKTLK